MILRLDLVHGWQRAYRWFSVQAAIAIVVISTVRETAQHIVDTVPELEWLAHAHWYPQTMTVLGVLAAVLRVIPQPKVTAPAEPSGAQTLDVPATPASPAPPASATLDPAAILRAAILNLGMDTTMSPIFRNILARIPQLVIDVESAFKGTPGSGADKAAVVTSIVASALPADASDGMAKAQAIMQMAVMFFNYTHPLFQKPGASTITAAFPAPTA